MKVTSFTYRSSPIVVPNLSRLTAMPWSIWTDYNQSTLLPEVICDDDI